MKPNLKKTKLPMETPPHSHRAVQRALLVLFVLLAASAAVISFVFIFDHRYEGRIFPGTTVGSLDLSGMTYDQARAAVESSTGNVLAHGVTLRYGSTDVPVKSTAGDAANPELATPLFGYDPGQTIQRIITETSRRSEADRLYYWLTGWAVAPSVDIAADELEQVLHEQLAPYEQPPADAQLTIGADGTLSVTPETSGQTFDYPAMLAAVRSTLERFSTDPIQIALHPASPAITSAAAAGALPLAKQVLAGAPYELVYGTRRWAVTRDQVQQWLTFKALDGTVSVGFRESGIKPYLESIAQEVDVPVQEPKFSMQDGKVLEFQPAQTGLSVDVAGSISRLDEKVRQIGIRDIDVVVVEQQPAATGSSGSELGIVELIGEGHSNFKGSPSNRRHNIATGADKLNGILIEPDEEFSLVKTLGEIEASTGYLPELVIKGNKTVPEYGGGLCQIGTTTFRAALDAGLPILERKNHSYRVSYYEPAGTDATIYDPKPDFRFKNDTGHHILFTTEIKGDDLYFRFYGTADGRTVVQTKPKITNQVRPGPTKLIETADLAPGVRKCIEKAHAGADAEFTRTVTSASGEVKTDVFKSHYKPWQEVCLVGAAQPAP